MNSMQTINGAWPKPSTTSGTTSSILAKHSSATKASGGTTWRWATRIAAPLAAERLADVRQQCRAARDQRVRHQRHREPHQLHRRHRTYLSAVVRKHSGAPDRLADDVQAVLDEFVSTNDWHRRQQEIVRRRDRDGEAFLRFFADPRRRRRGSASSSRKQVATPDRVARRPRSELRHPDRSPTTWRTVLGYYVDGTWSTPRRSSTARRTSTPTSSAACRCSTRCGRTSAGPRSCCGT